VLLIESILADPAEGPRSSFNADGTVFIYVATQSNGQGHETVYAAIRCRTKTGIPAELIHVIQAIAI